MIQQTRKPVDINLRSNRGFLSSTTSTYQFGILEKKQWISEERLLKDADEPMGYSVIAKTCVKGFTITKEDARRKFTKEIMDFIVKLVEQRYIWIKERAKKLTKATISVANMDPSDVKYDENYAETTKRFPIVTTYALTSISKRNLSHQEANSPNIEPEIGLNNEVSSPHEEMQSKEISQIKEVSQSIPNFNKTSVNPAYKKNLMATLPNRNFNTSLLPNINASQQGFVQKSFDFNIKKNEHQLPMALASSASKFVHRPSYTPYFTVRMGRMEKKKMRIFRRAGKGIKNDKEILTREFVDEMKKKELNKFVIGKRIIRLLEDERPDTPYQLGLIPTKFRTTAY